MSYIDAILGTEMKVATVDGEVDLKIAAGTQPETVTRLAEKGAPRLGGKGRGTVLPRITNYPPTALLPPFP